MTRGRASWTRGGPANGQVRSERSRWPAPRTRGARMLCCRKVRGLRGGIHLVFTHACPRRPANPRQPRMARVTRARIINTVLIPRRGINNSRVRLARAAEDELRRFLLALPPGSAQITPLFPHLPASHCQKAAAVSAIAVWRRGGIINTGPHSHRQRSFGPNCARSAVSCFPPVPPESRERRHLNDRSA